MPGLPGPSGRNGNGNGSGVRTRARLVLDADRRAVGSGDARTGGRDWPSDRLRGGSAAAVAVAVAVAVAAAVAAECSIGAIGAPVASSSTGARRFLTANFSGSGVRGGGDGSLKRGAPWPNLVLLLPDGGDCGCGCGCVSDERSSLCSCFCSCSMPRDVIEGVPSNSTPLSRMLSLPCS